MDDDKLKRCVAQAAETSRLFGVDFVPVYRKGVTVADGSTVDIVQEIGRKGIFGNPFRPAPGEELRGTTLEPYRKWLFAALMGERWAFDQYKEATGLELPVNYAKAVKELNDLPFICPGCKNRTEEVNVCHGSVLRKAVIWLNGLGCPIKC